jgi:hypothetical protein
MLRESELLKTFENDFLKNAGRLSFEQASRLFAGMWEEGLRLGVLPPKSPLDGIDADIRMARILNSCLKNSCQK